MDIEFFTSEYDRNYKKLYLVALSMLRDSQLAEDAVQEASLKAYKNFEQLKDKTLFSTWITRILINECKMILRKSKVVFESIDDIAESEYLNDNQLRFFEMLFGLKEKERKILSLRYFSQMSLEDISDVLKIPLSTVKSRLYRTLGQIKKDWGE